VSKTRAPTFEVAAVLNLTVLWSAFTLRQFVYSIAKGCVSLSMQPSGEFTARC
jgi:hypothetical protein